MIMNFSGSSNPTKSTIVLDVAHGDVDTTSSYNEIISAYESSAGCIFVDSGGIIFYTLVYHESSGGIYSIRLVSSNTFGDVTQILDLVASDPDTAMTGTYTDVSAASYTAGDGISIVNGVISLDIVNADNIAY